MINEKSTKLIQLVESKENEIFKDVLSDILKLEIEEIKYEKNIKLNDLSGYDFELVKLKVKLQTQHELEIYLKMVKKTKIKESIFCYWCSIYEEELIKKQQKENILNKVLISELTKGEFQQSIFLEIEDNTTPIIENGTKIIFLEIKNYIKEYNNKKNQLKKIEKYFIDEKDVLLLGIKANSTVLLK